MTEFGVVEGFFGPAWPMDERKSYAEFLAKVGGTFYIYAPKQDQHLRKGWREQWDEAFVQQMQDLAKLFQSYGLQFGVALSPFGLERGLSEGDRKLLLEKVSQLRSMNLDLLGVFFDDMPSDEFLADTQLRSLELITKEFPGKIIFCPTYYCFDPILEKVFGKKPENYLERIGAEVPARVSIAWTGPKVISPEIPLAHLQEAESLLKRKPFIWENLFANDGPRNCKFLKVRPFTGRANAILGATEAWGFNMMNQPNLSKITFLTSLKTLRDGINPETALKEALDELCPPSVSRFIQAHRLEFLEEGLDKLGEEKVAAFIAELTPMTDAYSREVLAWLKGEYVVGSECLTD